LLSNFIPLKNIILESKKIISSDQAGFRQNRGTLDQVASLAQAVKEGFIHNKATKKKQESTLAVSIDLSGAFDTTDRPYALKQMIDDGVPNNIINWLAGFINKRKIAVAHKGARSRQRHTRAGVAQGTITAPTTFIIAVDPLIRLLRRIEGVTVKVFADDFVIYITGPCPARIEIRMNFVLSLSCCWFKVRGFHINAQKTVYTYFTMSQSIYKFDILVNEEKIKETDKMKYLGVTLDPKMTGKHHFEEAAAKGRKRLRLLQRAAGVSWGSKSDTLALTYKTYIRPAMEYGTEIFPEASAAQQSQIDKVQNAALRLITGGVKTTPIEAMEWYCQIEPLQLRREQRAIQLHEKLARLDPDYWLSTTTSSVKAHKNFAETTNTLRERHCPGLLEIERQPFEAPRPQALPDLSNQLSPVTKIDGMEKKASHTRLKTKQLAEAHLKKYYPLPNWVQIFTDGSHDEEKGRTGFGVSCTFFEEAKPLSAGSTHFDAEVAAIVSAAEKVADSPHLPRNKTKFVILCDSISAAQFVTRADNLHPQALLFKNLLAALRRQNKTLELQWIPSHCDILGNEKADYLAKLAAKKTPPPGGTISFNKAKNKIKSAMKKVFKSTTEEVAKLKTWWEEVKKGPDKIWTRRTATAQFRLATGHDCLQHHLHRFNITNDPDTCKLCHKEPQDRAHLLRCEALKQEIDALPVDLSRTEKEAIIYWIARKKNSR
jgi:ribonuclease HI